MNIEIKVGHGVTNKKLKPSAIWDTPAYRNWYPQTGTPNHIFKEGKYVQIKPI